MKTITILSSLLFAASLAQGQTQRRELRLSECPQAVQSTVQGNARGGQIDEVDLISIDGKDIYIAEINLPRDRDLKVYVSGNGSLVKTREDILIREAPAAVRSAVQVLGIIDDIDKETAGQTVTYHVEVDRQGARDLDVVVSADGSILSQTEENDD